MRSTEKKHLLRIKNFTLNSLSKEEPEDEKLVAHFKDKLADILWFVLALVSLDCFIKTLACTIN